LVVHDTCRVSDLAHELLTLVSARHLTVTMPD
jgi:hypothetical protein